MKLVNRNIEVEFDLNADFINTLVVENQKFFSSCVKGLNALATKEESDFVISKDLEPIEIGDKIEIICDFSNLDLNNKRIVNGLIKHLTRQISDRNMEFREYFARGYNLLGGLTMDLLPNVEFEDEVDYGAFIKLFKPNFGVEKTQILLNLITYVDALIEFCNIKLLVLINAKSYFSIKEFEDLAKHLQYMQLPLCCIESHVSYRIKNEKLVLIDCDLCEIVL